MSPCEIKIITNTTRKRNIFHEMCIYIFFFQRTSNANASWREREIYTFPCITKKQCTYSYINGKVQLSRPFRDLITLRIKVIRILIEKHSYHFCFSIFLYEGEENRLQNKTEKRSNIKNLFQYSYITKNKKIKSNKNIAIAFVSAFSYITEKK